METVTIRPNTDFKEKADILFEEQKEKLLQLLPFADIQHIGATAVPGLLTKGDLDINVRVKQNEFEVAVNELKRLYEINQPNNWTDSFASFKDDSTDLPLGVQLTVIDSNGDHFIKHREVLKNNPNLVEELNKIKQKFDGGEMESYREAKARFLKSL